MSRVLKQKKVWVSVVTCTKCGAKTEFWHHGCVNKREAIRDMPSQYWNGWRVIEGEELCSLCEWWGRRK